MSGIDRALPGWVAAGLVFVASGAVLVLEIVGLRLVAPYVGVTLQTSSAVIGIALAAIAYGAWFGGYLADRLPPRMLLAPALLFGAVATAVTLPAVRWLGPALRGSSLGGVLLISLLALFLPAAALSTVPPLVVKSQLADLSRTGIVVGRLSGIGTLGAITATFGTGFVLVAALPSSAIVLTLAAVLAVTGAALAAYTRKSGTRVGVGAATVLAAIGLAGATLTALLPTPCAVETAYHCASVESDPDRRSGRQLYLNSATHSYVDLDDPTYLQYSYIQAIASALDAARPTGAPMTSLHIGAGGMTIPRYLAANRPGGRARVLEVDGDLLALDNRRFGPVADATTWAGDGRVGLAAERTGSYDAVVGDAFGHLSVPWHLTTRELVADVRRVLRPDGIYALNVIDGERSLFAKAETATLRAVFRHVAVVATPESFSNGPSANYVLVASDTELPLPALTRRLKERTTDLTVVDGPRLTSWLGPAAVLTDDHAPVDQLRLRSSLLPLPG